MIWTVKIALFVAEAVLWGLALRYYLYIFQQNSYRHERFMRWLRGNRGLLPRLLFRTSKVGFKMTPRMLRLTVTASVLFAAAAAWLSTCKEKHNLGIFPNLLSNFATCDLAFL